MEGYVLSLLGGGSSHWSVAQPAAVGLNPGWRHPEWRVRKIVHRHMTHEHLILYSLMSRADM